MRIILILAFFNFYILHAGDTKINQIVENSKCVGIKIESEKGFIYTTLPSSYKIQETNNQISITDKFILSLNDNGKTLILKTKPGALDFGKGNTMVITINKSAINDAKNDLELKLKTDVVNNEKN